MAKFTDNIGRVWLLQANCNTLRAVQAATGVNLGDLRSIDTLIDRLRGDDLFVGEVACAMLGDQLAKEDVKPADFLRSMSNDRIGEAADAIREELAHFFRDPATRSAVAKLLSLSRQAQSATIAAINLTSGGTATNSPGSSASTPDPTPSAS